MGIDVDKIKELLNENKYFTTKGTIGEQGTGLGLMLVKEMLLKNGGFLKINPNPTGIGITVSFILPVREIIS